MIGRYKKTIIISIAKYRQIYDTQTGGQCYIVASDHS